MRAEETETCLGQPLVQKVASKSLSHRSAFLFCNTRKEKETHFGGVDVSPRDLEVFFKTCL